MAANHDLFFYELDKKKESIKAFAPVSVSHM